MCTTDNRPNNKILKKMGLNKYDALHIFTILWLSSVSISLISLSILYEQTDRIVQKSLDIHVQNNDPFVMNHQIFNADLEGNYNGVDSIKVEEKYTVDTESIIYSDDEKINMFDEEVEDTIFISSSQSRHKGKSTNFESALKVFSDELEKYDELSKKTITAGFNEGKRLEGKLELDSKRHDSAEADIEKKETLILVFF